MGDDILVFLQMAYCFSLFLKNFVWSTMMFTSRPRICTAVIVPCPMDWGSMIGPLVHVLEKTWFEHKKTCFFFYDVSFWKSVA